MNKLKDIRSFEELKEFAYLHRDIIKKAALPVMVTAAVLFFWILGLNDEKTIDEERLYGGDGSEYGEAGAEDKGYEAEENDEGSRREKEVQASGVKLYVDISGCVKKPGVYEVEEGTRLFQLIEKAGGLTDEADTESINRAEAVSDGQKIIIYKKGEASEGTVSGGPNGTDLPGKININTADSGRLQDIPGVGPVTADKIIQYREENGRFASIEDIKNVSGIGDKTFEKLKDHITV